MSLDTLRGFDMFFIMGGDALFVTICSLFPGTWMSGLGKQMYHVAWDGFTFYDLIFPLFLFLAGVSFPFSLAKQRSMGKDNVAISKKIVSRGLLLILFGAVYNGLLQFDFAELRYASVLGRIGSAWMFAALLYLWLGRKVTVWVSMLLLLGYWALLAWVPVPGADSLSPFSMDGSLVSYIDRLLLPGRLHDGLHDPEGVLSTLPAIVTALLGMFTGEFVRLRSLGAYKKVAYLLLAALALLFIGWVWSFVFPINKNLWSSSFVCFAGGWSLILFALFYFIVDVLQWRGWTLFFRVIGLNSITIYLAQQFVDFHKLNTSLLGGVMNLLPAPFYPVAYWACYVAVCWCLLYFLYRKKIFLKV